MVNYTGLLRTLANYIKIFITNRSGFFVDDAQRYYNSTVLMEKIQEDVRTSKWYFSCGVRGFINDQLQLEEQFLTTLKMIKKS